MPTHTRSILVLGAGLALTTAACSGTGDTSAAGAPTTAAAPTTASATAAANPTTAAATTAPAPTGTKATSRSTASPIATAKQVCPVTAATLRAAMKADEGGAIALKAGVTLGKPECYAGWVLVAQRSIKDANGNPVTDDEIATFKYESGSWRYLVASTADFCEGMPAATRKHFESHYDGGCGG